jgi:hypothetical protein
MSPPAVIVNLQNAAECFEVKGRSLGLAVGGPITDEIAEFGWGIGQGSAVDPPGQYRGNDVEWIAFLVAPPTDENVINLAEAHCSMAARRRVQFVFGAIFCKRAGRSRALRARPTFIQAPTKQSRRQAWDWVRPLSGVTSTPISKTARARSAHFSSGVGTISTQMSECFVALDVRLRGHDDRNVGLQEFSVQ